MKQWVRYISLLFIVSLMGNQFLIAQNQEEVTQDVEVQETDDEVFQESPDNEEALTSDEVADIESEEGADNQSADSDAQLPEDAQEATLNEDVVESTATSKPAEVDEPSVEQEDEQQALEEASIEPTDDQQEKTVQETIVEDQDTQDALFVDEDSTEVTSDMLDDQDEDELVGIDTIDLNEPQGNWLFKRHWWERAEKRYEKIRENVALVLEARMSFFQKRSNIDRNLLDPFYLQIGLDQASLEYVISELLGKLLKEREQDGMLEDHEREWLDQLLAKQTTLEQIKLNAQAINKIDHDVDDALETLMQQVNRAREYEREAWNYFKEIARVLNDKRARELVMRMKNINRNVKQVYEYIRAQFSPYYEKLIQTIQEKTTQIKQDVDLLKEGGIDLQQQMNYMKQGEQEEPVREVEPESVKPTEQPGFFSRYIITPISHLFSLVWNGIVAIVRLPYDLLFGSKKAAQPEPAVTEDGAVSISEESEESISDIEE